MKLNPAFPDKNIPIAISCSNKYVPYVSVMLQSVIENSSDDRNYDIIILNKDFEENNKNILKKQCNRPNFSIRFFDVNEYIAGRDFYTKNLSIEAYFRMFLIDIMQSYDKTLYFDVDISVQCDVAELFDIDIKDNYVAAAVDVNIVGSYISGNHWKPYIDDVLCLKNPEGYIQSGVMVINLKEMRKSFSLKFITEICVAKEWRLFDQDILNSICQDRIYYLDMKYNTINGQEGRMENIEKWTPSYLKKEWYEARKAPKIIHYVGKKKPWLSFNAEYADYFWEYAKRSMFYHNLIVSRVNQIEMLQTNEKIYALEKKINSLTAAIESIKNNTANAPAKIAASAAKPQVVSKPAVVLPEKRKGDAVLFRCQSVYQLFNAVNITLTSLSKRKVDIMLTATTDFSEYYEPLKKSGLFRRVLTSEDNPSTYIDWRSFDKKTQEDLSRNPEKYIFPLENEPDYSDYYIAVADEYNKLFYYYLLKSGCYVDIHMYEDGMNSYILKHTETCMYDFIDHDIYQKNSFALKICETLTYEPDVAINHSSSYKANRIPKIESNNKTKHIFNSIFPHESLPSEKYIFMEEAFYCDGIASTDVELVEHLAELVGKENIIIKLHPRNGYDRFSGRGFKVMQMSRVPWEMTLLNDNFDDKVFVTVSSTSALTAGLVFGKKFTAINLFKVMVLGKNIHVQNAHFLDFYEMLQQHLNKDSLQMFTPLSMDELDEEIFFIEGGLE